MSSLSICPRSNIDGTIWNEFVLNEPTAWFWHFSELIAALSLWNGKSDLSFAVMDHDEIVALFPLHLVKRYSLGILPIHRLESMGGLSCKSTLSPRISKKVSDFAVNHVKELQQQFNAWETRVFISPLTPYLATEKAPKVNPLLDLGFKNEQSQSWIVDLRKEEAKIFQSYSQTTRNEIRRIGDSHPVIREAHSDEDLEIYYQLHKETYQRTGAKPHPKAYFASIFQNFIRRGFARILFLEKEGSVIVSQNTLFFKKRAYYWTGASSDQRLGGETKYLCHLQMLHAKSLGCEFYEVGEGFPQLKVGKSVGLNTFKRSLGGELYPFYRGVQFSSNQNRRFLSGLYYLFQEQKNG